MQFTKMHGAGNDYVYVDCFQQAPPEDPAGLDYYACGSDELCTAIEEFIDDRAIPRSRYLYQANQQKVESLS